MLGRQGLGKASNDHDHSRDIFNSDIWVFKSLFVHLYLAFFSAAKIPTKLKTPTSDTLMPFIKLNVMDV